MLGQVAAIGRQWGAASILGQRLSGFLARLLLRSAYLIKSPTLVKKLRVVLEWTLDILHRLGNILHHLGTWMLLAERIEKL